MHKQSPTNTLYSPPLGERGLQKKHQMCFCASGGENSPVRRADKAGGRVFLLLLFFLLLQSCRHDIIVWPSEEEEVGDTRQDSILGFYLLNEGNRGSNKGTMDYYDYTTGTYIRNIYGNANPSAVKELGDVGNALRI